MKTSIFVIYDGKNRFATYYEDTVFEYVKNKFDSSSYTPVKSDHYYSDLPTDLPDADYLIVESVGFRNWKLYKVIREDKGWIRSCPTSRVELVEEITCEEVEHLEQIIII